MIKPERGDCFDCGRACWMIPNGTFPRCPRCTQAMDNRKAQARQREASAVIRDARVDSIKNIPK